MMDELITAYLEENYIVVFASIVSYYCYDVESHTKMSLRVVENELRLIFGVQPNAKLLLYKWVSSKTNYLKEISKVHKDRIYDGSLSLDELNDMLIKEDCTHLCT